MSFGKAIKKLRKDAGLSQQELADKLGMARSTYASLEVERREPDLGELKALADFYEISMMELVAEEGDDWPGVISETHGKYYDDNAGVPKKAIQSTDDKKLRELLLYVLGEIGAKPNFGASVLQKLLYIIDTEYLQHHARNITGLQYINGNFGPKPAKSFHTIIESMVANGELEVVTTKHYTNTDKKYLPTVVVYFNELSANELQHINKILSLYGNKTASELDKILRQDKLPIDIPDID